MLSGPARTPPSSLESGSDGPLSSKPESARRDRRPGGRIMEEDDVRTHGGGCIYLRMRLSSLGGTPLHMATPGARAVVSPRLSRVGTASGPDPASGAMASTQ